MPSVGPCTWPERGELVAMAQRLGLRPFLLQHRLHEAEAAAAADRTDEAREAFGECLERFDELSELQRPAEASALGLHPWKLRIRWGLEG